MKPRGDATDLRRLVLIPLCGCEILPRTPPLILLEVATLPSESNRMSLLFNVIYAWKAKGTHHKLALDGLLQLRGEHAEGWRNLFLQHIEPFLKGAKAPDDQFKDFKNHVYHVSDGGWGGAPGAAVAWYVKTVAALRERHWSEAAFNAGVLSHYCTDPVQPFHTGQSEDEGPVHRPGEWSIACAYGELRAILMNDLGGFPSYELPAGNDWLQTAVRQGAELAHPHYHVLIDHYDLAKGVKKPVEGLDQESKDRIAGLIGHAAVFFGRVLERAIEEAATTPPAVPVTILGVLAQLTVPLFWVTKQLAPTDRKLVEAMYAEFCQTGKVVATLPESDRALRQMHAEEVLHQPVENLLETPIRAPGTQYGTGAAARTPAVKEKPQRAPRPQRTPKPAAAPVGQFQQERPPTPVAKETPRRAAQTAASDQTVTEQAVSGSPARSDDPYYLHLADDIVDAPCIGPKTANQFRRVGIHTVANFLDQIPETIARKLAQRTFDATTATMAGNVPTDVRTSPFTRIRRTIAGGLWLDHPSGTSGAGRNRGSPAVGRVCGDRRRGAPAAWQHPSHIG